MQSVEATHEDLHGLLYSNIVVTGEKQPFKTPLHCCTAATMSIAVTQVTVPRSLAAM